MRKINSYYVEVTGSYTHNHMIGLLGEDIEFRLYVDLCLVGTTKPIKVYRLEPDEMNKLEASRVSEKLVFSVYRRTIDGLAPVLDLKQSLAQHFPENRPSQISSPAVRKTKAQLKKVISRKARQAFPLVTA